MYRRDETSAYLFHYTEAEDAEAIAADGYFQVGTGANFGFGLYATDLSPQEACADEIRAVCFEGDAASNAFDGVVVLVGNNPLFPFSEVDRRVFLLPAREGAGELISLEPILAGVGLRSGGVWNLEFCP